MIACANSTTRRLFIWRRVPVISGEVTVVGPSHRLKGNFVGAHGADGTDVENKRLKSVPC